MSANKALMVTIAIILGVAMVYPQVANKKTGATASDASVDSTQWTLVNRSLSTINEGNREVLSVDSRKGAGLLLHPETQFGDGTIEFDVKGKNVPQKSFVGLAFHGVSEEMYDAIYFRPFNFNSPDSASHSHAVQYISIPGNGWKTLRDTHPGEYENSLDSPPDPDSWFHVRVELKYPQVRVYVNRSEHACLSVTQLSDHREGWVGFWVGDDSDGEFAGLKLTPR